VANDKVLTGCVLWNWRLFSNYCGGIDGIDVDSVLKVRWRMPVAGVWRSLTNVRKWRRRMVAWAARQPIVSIIGGGNSSGGG